MNVMSKKQQWNDLPELVTVQEVADYLRVHHVTIRNMIARNEIKVVSLGKHRTTRIFKSEIEKLFT